MNRAAFYTSVRSRTSGVFGTSLTQGQVEGCEAILNEAEKRGTPLQHLAYILATAYHETAHTMQAVRETLLKSDASAIAALDRAYAAGRLGQVSKPYWRKDADGKSWLGRGLVQLTHKANYQKMSLILGVDLVADPSKAMELPIAVRIIFDGMELGSFTTQALDDHIKDGKANYVSARKIINGTDKATLIASYARAFEEALTNAGYAAVPVPAPKPVVAPPAPPVAESKPVNSGKLDNPATIERQPTTGNWLATLLSALLAALKGNKA